MKQQKNRRGKNTFRPSGRLRIVAGKWRSRLLPVVDEPGLRPTPERVRETLFNWLAPHIAGARCLDLFAGTGALGFEALSRGAGEVVFVERSARASRMLEANTALLEADGARIHATSAESYLGSVAAGAFDVVFLDPPFDEDRTGELCRLLQDSGHLGSGALVYLEQEKSQAVPALPDGWRLLKEKTAGNVRYSLAATE